MNTTGKIIITSIVVVVVLGGIYYWRNSSTTDTSNQAENASVTSEENTNEEATANWETYTSTGVSIRYPNDGTYTVDEGGIDPDLEGFTIAQEHPGNAFHIYKTSDSPDRLEDGETKEINGKTYNVFRIEGMGNGYGYSIKNNDAYYVFQSIYGPENEDFELLMTTVEFEE